MNESAPEIQSWWSELEYQLSAGIIEPARDGSCNFVPVVEDE